MSKSRSLHLEKTVYKFEYDVISLSMSMDTFTVDIHCYCCVWISVTQFKSTKKENTPPIFKELKESK